jgi:hypothetical protein
MAKRLQLILPDPDYEEIQRIARSRRMSIAEWVRKALGLALRRELISDASKKLEVIRAAVQHEYPVGDIDSMWAEVESRYGTGTEPSSLLTPHPHRAGAIGISRR